MKVVTAEDYNEQSRIAAGIVSETVGMNPHCRIGLATGSSPLGMYRELIRMYREEGLSFKNIHTVNLDEYIGLESGHAQSFRHFMNSNFFDHIDINKKNTYVVSGVGDISSNIVEFEEILNAHPRKIQVLGVGEDGHLGFNEPRHSLTYKVHAEKLDESTVKANARFFSNGEEVPREAITMGMGGIMQAERILLIISGDKSHAARQLLISDLISTDCPVTFLKLHRDVTVIIDWKTAEEIGYTY